LIYVFGLDKQLIEDRTYYVADDGGNIVGAGAWSRRQKLYTGDQQATIEDIIIDPWTSPARLRSFCVHPLWAGQGIGKALLQRCEEAARRESFESAELVTTPASEHFFKATGYHRIESMEISTWNGSVLPATRMRKTFRIS